MQRRCQGRVCPCTGTVVVSPPPTTPHQTPWICQVKNIENKCSLMYYIKFKIVWYKKVHM
jgi:hypothetical protein